MRPREKTVHTAVGLRHRGHPSTTFSGALLDIHYRSRFVAADAPQGTLWIRGLG